MSRGKSRLFSTERIKARVIAPVKMRHETGGDALFGWLRGGWEPSRVMELPGIKGKNKKDAEELQGHGGILPDVPVSSKS